MKAAGMNPSSKYDKEKAPWIPDPSGTLSETGDPLTPFEAINPK